MFSDKISFNAEYRLSPGDKWTAIPLVVWGNDAKVTCKNPSWFPSDLSDNVFFQYHVKIGDGFRQVSEDEASELVEKGICRYGYRCDEAYVTNPDIVSCGVITGKDFVDVMSGTDGLSLMWRAAVEMIRVYVEEPGCEVRMIWCSSKKC